MEISKCLTKKDLSLSNKLQFSNPYTSLQPDV